MERLTEYMGNGNDYESINPIDTPYEYGKANLQALINKLAAYEDAEEQGLLLRLPCKVGDTVYVIYYIDRHYVIYSHIISKFVIMPYRFPRVQIYFEKENGFLTSDFEGQLNDNLFLTREEAEAKLAEMEEKDGE